jgi:uncharacterized protein YcfL
MSEQNPSPEALLRLLDSEIEHARAEEQRGGWNNWALGGALAAIVGFACSLWQSNALSHEVTILWVLALATILDPLATRIWSWAHHEHPRLSGMRYQFFSDLETRRLAYAWWAARALFLALAAVTVWDGGVSKAALVWSVVNYIGIAAGMMLLVWISYLDWPFATSIPTGRYLRWISVAFWCIILMVTVSYFLQLTFPRSGAPNHEFIIAVLMLAASYLLFRLLFDIRRPVRIDRLVEIRRDLLLGHIPLIEAIQAAEITLIGMEGRTVLQEHLRRTLALHRIFAEHAVRVDFLLHTALSMLNESECMMGAGGVGKDVRARSSKKLKQAETALKQAEQLQAKINRRMVWYDEASAHVTQESPHSLFQGDNYKQLSMIHERVSQANARLDSDLSTLRTNLEKVREAVLAAGEEHGSNGESSK